MKAFTTTGSTDPDWIRERAAYFELLWRIRLFCAAVTAVMFVIAFAWGVLCLAAPSAYYLSP